MLRMMKGTMFFILLWLTIKLRSTIKFLLKNTTIDLNASNAYGFTAMDITFVQMARDIKLFEIRDLLQRAGAATSKSQLSQPPPPPPLVRPHKSISSSNNLSHETSNSTEENTWEVYFAKQDQWLDKQRDALMVVAPLIATMAFQAGLSPLGGSWGENDGTHIAWSSIMAYRYPEQYLKFSIYNTIGFVSSLSIVLLLISGLPMKNRVFMWVLMVIMWVSITAVALSYSVSSVMFTVVNDENGLKNLTALGVAISCWIGLMAVLLILLTICIVMIITRKGRRFYREHKGSFSINSSS